MRQGRGCFEQEVLVGAKSGVMLAGPVSRGCWQVMGVGGYRCVLRLGGVLEDADGGSESCELAVPVGAAG